MSDPPLSESSQFLYHWVMAARRKRDYLVAELRTAEADLLEAEETWRAVGHDEPIREADGR